MQHKNPTKTYYLKFRVFAIIIIFFGIVFILFESGLLFTPINYDVKLHAWFYIMLLTLLMLSISRIRIVTSPNGISYHNPGLPSIHSSWENIDQISNVEFIGFGKRRCIILKPDTNLGWLAQLTWPIPKHKVGHVIPLNNVMYEGWDKVKELENDIKAYAPNIIGLED